jgi:hypothetical protein
MKSKIGRITTATLLLAMVVLLAVNLFVPRLTAIPVGQAVEFLGAFTGPRTGYDAEDNVNSSLNQLHAGMWGYANRSVEGASMKRKFWYVDANVGASGTGKSPGTAFKTIQEAISASSNTTDDWIFVFDYSGGGATITINKSFIHLIGNANKAAPYPRIKPATAVAGITITDAGDRVEIAHLVIGGGDQSVPAITFSGAGGSYGVWIHDNVIGRDSDAPGNDGILVPSGTAAPYLLVENNIFHGSAGSGLDQSGIQIDGNATRGAILNNMFSDLGTAANPAIYLSGGVTQVRIEGNRIAADDDNTVGWGITIGASCADCWINNNYAGSGSTTSTAEAFDDDSGSGEDNNWGVNWNGDEHMLPDD